MSQLGYWIELLWPVLQEASGSALDAIPSHLPEPAAKEWRRARGTLETFSHPGRGGRPATSCIP